MRNASRGERLLVNRQTLPSLLIFRANFSLSASKSNVSVTMFPQKDFICGG